MRKTILAILVICLLCSSASAVIGEDWISFSAPDERQWSEVAYGNGVIVAVSNDADGNESLMVSNNGVTFEMIGSPNESVSWNDIIWDNENSQFVAVGNNAIMLSPDGTTWTEIESPIPDGLWGVASGDGYLMAVTPYGTDRMIYSEDAGLTWHIYSNGAQFNAYEWSCVGYGNGSFIAASTDGVISEVFTSQNLMSGGTTSTSSHTYQDIIFDNNTWVIISSAGDYRPTYKPSKRDVTGGWSYSTTSIVGNWYSVSYGANKFVAVENGGDGIMTSPDAVSWVEHTAPSSEFWYGLGFCENDIGGEMFISVALGATDDDIMTSGFIAPYLISPTNNTIYTESYPPLLHDIPLVWEGLNSSGFRYQVAKDINFNTLVVDSSTTLNSATVSLQDGTYYWRVAGYSNELDDYMDYTNPWTFTINAASTTTGTAIEGTVYSSSGVLLPGTRVTAYNDDSTYDYITTSNGYFLFQNGSNGILLTPGTYVLQASKDGYETNSLNVVNVTIGETVTKNIILEEENAPNYILPHYVSFRVRSINDYYEGVVITIYEGDSATALYTLTTGSDGAAGAELSETVRYRITAYKDGVIDAERYVYPTDNEYIFWVDIDNIIYDLLNPDDSEQEITAIDIDVSKIIINDNTANIQVVYNDTMSETSNLNFILSQSIENDPDNTTTISSVSYGSTNTVTHNFTVSNYDGKSYFVRITADHTTHGDINRYFGVQFENTSSRFGFAGEVVGWFAILALVFVALSATQATVPQTAIGVCALASVLKMIGWGMYVSSEGLMLAWVISIAANLAKGKESGA